ncbi:nuclease-related domain-containing protein [Metallibacterium scheffleri]|uniref:NERD domain-containing protein n=1 Tax=Metallibacterium scheffleri TaxID=993689 RepID=A0A4S3KMP3_9GAMM|nr:nuclease-related domain-containing protein [Metallibacterium scheffleri]THD10079.1 hypothetical protein B1806_09420 [Metallibacterium scheffleri]
MAHSILRQNDQRKRLLAVRVIAGLVMATGFMGFITLLTLGAPGAHFIPAVILMLVAGAALTVLRHTDRAAAGARGEAIALRTALQLPSDFTVFNNVLVPGRAGGRPRELDLVAVGPHCVFVLEVKHYKGEIMGSRDAPQWKLRKVGRGGTVYYSTVSNPLRQVASASAALASYLKSHGVRSWVQGAVCFTRSYPPPPIAPGADSILVTAPETLRGLLENWKPARAGHDANAAADALRPLMAPAWVNQALRSRPELR